MRRAVHNLSFEEHDRHAEDERKRLEALNGTGVNGEDDLGVGDEDETEDLLSLDPKEWKVYAETIYIWSSLLSLVSRDFRNKIITQFSDSHTYDTMLRMTRLRLHVRRRRHLTLRIDANHLLLRFVTRS